MITIEKLRMFCFDLKFKGYEINVPESILFRQIMENFGAEQRIVRDVAKTLRQLGFMRPLGTGIWEYMGEFVPKDKEEKVAQKEEIKTENPVIAHEESTELKTDEFGNVI